MADFSVLIYTLENKSSQSEMIIKEVKVIFL